MGKIAEIKIGDSILVASSDHNVGGIYGGDYLVIRNMIEDPVYLQPGTILEFYDIWLFNHDRSQCNKMPKATRGTYDNRSVFEGIFLDDGKFINLTDILSGSIFRVVSLPDEQGNNK